MPAFVGNQIAILFQFYLGNVRELSDEAALEGVPKHVPLPTMATLLLDVQLQTSQTSQPV